MSPSLKEASPHATVSLYSSTRFWGTRIFNNVGGGPIPPHRRIGVSHMPGMYLSLCLYCHTGELGLARYGIGR